MFLHFSDCALKLTGFVFVVGSLGATGNGPRPRSDSAERAQPASYGSSLRKKSRGPFIDQNQPSGTSALRQKKYQDMADERVDKLGARIDNFM